jgi:hypothetical protein
MLYVPKATLHSGKNRMFASGRLLEPKGRKHGENRHGGGDSKGGGDGKGGGNGGHNGGEPPEEKPVYENESALSAAISTYLAGEPVTVVARGAAYDASSVYMFRNMLRALVLHSTIQGTAQRVTVYSTLQVSADSPVVFRKTGVVRLPMRTLFYNPLDAPLTITSFDLSISVVTDGVVGAVNATHVYGKPDEPLRLEVPAKQQTMSGEDDAFVCILKGDDAKSKERVEKVLAALIDGSRVMLSVEGTFGMRVGKSVAQPFYRQAAMPLCAHGADKSCKAYAKEHPPTPEPTPPLPTLTPKPHA